MYRIPFVVSCLLALAGSPYLSSGAEVDFAHDVVPILQKHCGKCHTGEKKEGAFSLNTHEQFLKGGEGGPVAEAKKSMQSELIRRMKSTDKNDQMPPEGPRVPADKIAILEKWIDEGMKWEEGFAFQKPAYEPPLKPRKVTLPAAVAGRENPVDRIVDAYLASHNTPLPQTASDSVFVRRVYLDLVGLLPTAEQSATFLADKRPNKRDLLVEELLADNVAYADHWLTFWNDLLRNDYTGTGFITGGRKQITTWLYDSLVNNKPYDQFVRELISPTPDSEGFIQGIKWRGEVNSSQTLEIQFAQNISQAFLGINMKCASCHDSFVDRWKLDEAYGLAAIFAKEPLQIHRCDKPTGKMAKAAWIFPELGQVDAAAPQPERLKQLAALMTHPENGRLTRTVVNRLWHRLLGRGIVSPVDAMHTEPWNADLLDYLAADFAEHGYDLKHTLKLICTSQAYQAKTPSHTAQPASGSFQYAGPSARRMTAEQFVDAVWQVTGTAPTKPDAVVNRAPRTSSGKPAEAPLAATGKWIWNTPDASGAVPKANETLALQKVIELPSAVVRGIGVITCDNSYKLIINGQAAAADDNWETVEAVDVGKLLRPGKNEILILATNGGQGPNPAGLYFEAHLTLADGSKPTIATDNSWQWTASLPNAQGVFSAPPTDWKKADIITNPAVWAGRVSGSITSILAGGGDSSLRMVRSSLVKSDYLMRSLGRPNRDQIVSTRPTDLTTLEAIDLANGQILADTLDRGGRQLMSRGWKSADELVDWLYMTCLTRKPTESEKSAAKELLGDEPHEDQVEDLIWAVLMLPEFQLVR
ncbi:MAG: DUF1549 domain-containing protein [Planctomycetaceae bacterium]